MRRRKQSRKYVPIVVGVALVGGLAWWATAQVSNYGRAAVLGTTTTPSGRNQIRRVELQGVADSLTRYIADRRVLPVALPSVATGICSSITANCRTTSMVDLSFMTGNYMAMMPSDPVGGSGAYASGYDIARGADGRIVLTAPRAEQKVSISITVK